MNFFDTRYNNNLPSKMWADCPWLAAMADPSIAHYWFEDFNACPDADYQAAFTIANHESGTFALTDGAGGLMELDTGSPSDGQGLRQVQRIGLPIALAANKDLWWDCRFKAKDNEGDSEFAIGLSKTNNAILNTDNGTPEDAILFYNYAADDTKLGVHTAKGASKETTADSGKVITDGWHTVGIKAKGISKLEFWFDDEIIKTHEDSDDIPVVALRFSLAFLQKGAARAKMDIDYWKYLQLR